MGGRPGRAGARSGVRSWTAKSRISAWQIQKSQISKFQISEFRKPENLHPEHIFLKSEMLEFKIFSCSKHSIGLFNLGARTRGPGGSLAGPGHSMLVDHPPEFLLERVSPPGGLDFLAFPIVEVAGALDLAVLE